MSAGVSGFVASSALAMAASRHLYELAGKESNPRERSDLLKRAAQLADSARQNDLAAYELAVREGKANDGDGLTGVDEVTRRAEAAAEERRAARRKPLPVATVDTTGEAAE